MASREEEKRLRREEREKAEAAAAASQSRAKRLRYLIGGLLAIAAVVGVVLLATGGDDNGGDTRTPATADDGSGAAIPEPAERDLAKAAETADCVVTSPAVQDSPHVQGKVEYKDNPPTSGQHSDASALDGIYETGQEPPAEAWVHSLQHGRVNIMYRKGTSPELVAQLETLASEPLNGRAAYKTLLFQNDTQMPFAVAAAAWGQLITCDKASDAMFDALRNFRVRYMDKGPETGVPPNN